MNIIEGRKPVLEALRAGRIIRKIILAQGIKEDAVIREIITSAQKNSIPIQRVDRQKIFDLSGSDVHQGIIAETEPYKYKTLEDIIDKAKAGQRPPFIIVLDRITDPHNLGSIIRTAEGCGAHGVIIPQRNACGITPTVIKASAGAVEHIPVTRVVNITRTLNRLKQQGFWIIGADMEGSPYYSADLTGPIALVLGSEGQGIGRLVKESCDLLVSIPMMGRVQSLNVSVAGAILMYEVLRQRRDI
ncbi:MAG: 23S rRNA (guanosine(2251)-2'-O)-methyltransferase RlmB [Mahellales bacterium]